MAEEHKEEANLTPEVANGGDVSGKSDKKKNVRPRKDEKPIEELFDLTKPIPRVPRPSKEEFDRALQAVDDAVTELKNKRQAIQNEIDKTMEGNSKTEASKQRDLLHELRMKIGILINEKKKIRDRLKSIREVAEKKENERKSTKQTLKFTTIKEIEDEIRRLQKKQETTNVSLMEEKKIIKEIDALNASKKLVATLKGKEQELENSKEQRANIAAELKAKDVEIDAVQKAIDEKQELVKALSEKDTDHRDKLARLFSERDAVKDEIDQKFKEKNSIQNEFRAKNDEYFAYTRAVKAQKKLQYEEEKKRREEEREAYLKKQEEEELKKIPYEEEQALCEYLAKFLTITYLEAPDKETEKGESKSEATVPVVENPFANLKPVNKKTDDVFLQMGGGKKPRERKSKQVKKQDKQIPFKLSMDTFEQFALIDLVPPTSLEEVSKSVKELIAKKEWYAKQPRGSVPTAKEIRKANESAAAKLRSKAEEVAGKETNQTKKKQGTSEFSLKSDDFVPLGAGTSNSSLLVNSTWRQNTPAEEVVVEVVEDAA